MESSHTTKTQKPLTFHDLTQQYLTAQETIVKGTTLKKLISGCNILNEIIGEETLANQLNAKYVKRCFAVKYDAYLAYVRKTCENITSKRITPHTFRHTHASILAENGVDYEAITRRLGHEKGSSVTREVYIHVTQKMLNRDKAQINRVNFF